MDIFDYLNQDRRWLPKGGSFVQISDMDHVWRKNAARWLLRHAASLRMEYRMIEDTADPSAYVQPSLSEVLEDISKPDQWITRTALYQALVAELPADPRNEFYWRTHKAS